MISKKEIKDHEDAVGFWTFVALGCVSAGWIYVTLWLSNFAPAYDGLIFGLAWFTPGALLFWRIKVVTKCFKERKKKEGVEE